MDLISYVTLAGGAIDRSALLAVRGRNEVNRALADGTLERMRRGHVALATSPEQVRRASALGGVLSHRSAAAHWGWAQKSVPEKAEVTVPRTTRVPAASRREVIPHWSDLQAADVTRMTTTPRRTLVDCMRNLALDEALPIVDSALRAGDITSSELRGIAVETRGEDGSGYVTWRMPLPGWQRTGSSRSCARRCCWSPGSTSAPSTPSPCPAPTSSFHPDLADPVRKLAFEGEGFQWHSDTAALTRDCRRYNLLTLLGWRVIRFSWPLVMGDAAYVQRVLIETVRLSDQRGPRSPAWGQVVVPGRAGAA